MALSRRFTAYDERGEPIICRVCRGSGLYVVDVVGAKSSHGRRCPNCHGRGYEPPAFGQNMKQPAGFNPPPLELRSPEPKKGQML